MRENLGEVSHPALMRSEFYTNSVQRMGIVFYLPRKCGGDGDRVLRGSPSYDVFRGGSAVAIPLRPQTEEKL